MFGKRQALFICLQGAPDPETAMLTMRAYYAEEGQQQAIANFCRNYDVDYLVVDSRSFDADAKAASYCPCGPYDHEFRKELALRTDFALADLSGKAKLFQSGTLVVVHCEGKVLLDS